MKRVVLVAFTVHEDTEHGIPTDADLTDGIRARLDEFYPTDDGYPCVPVDVRVTVTDPDAARKLVAAASIGLEGCDADDLDADRASRALGTLDRRP